MEKISSGIKGLDEILKGGFIRGRAYLITGGPGTGKTTLCLHFLEKTLREFQITRYGIKVGEPLTNLKNILTGIPVLVEEK